MNVFVEIAYVQILESLWRTADNIRRWWRRLWSIAIPGGQEVLVPTFELAANPTIRLSEVRARRFYIVDRAQIRARTEAQSEEDRAIFTSINGAMPQVETMSEGSVTVQWNDCKGDVEGD